MLTVCELNKYAGCMACMSVCRQKAILIRDDLLYYNAVIDGKKCVGCNLCHNICPNNSSNDFLKPIAWYQGWLSDEKLRKESSSGGVATALAYAVIAQNGCVFSCTFSNGQFCFDMVDSAEQLKKFAGSKYVKSNPEGIYSKVNEKLNEGKLVLFIGLPCQVAALKKVVKQRNENLITVDLICHGSPSPKVLDRFLVQYGCGLKDISSISFRNKEDFRVSKNARSITPKGVRDRYMIAFLNGLIYTENCYSCNYARTERVSDITIGDSWGSDLPAEEQKRGISLILVQTDKGQQLLNRCALQFQAVNKEKAIAANHQLSHPSERPLKRELFFKGILEGKKFNLLVKACYPKTCIKQDVKSVLVKAGILQGGVKIDYRVEWVERE